MQSPKPWHGVETMTHFMIKTLAATCLALGLAPLAYAQSPAQTAPPAPVTDAQAMLVAKGKSLAIAADCMACHTTPEGGKPYAGGYAISSPLGVIYATNITPSKTAGIGSYSEEQFARALREGVRADGAHLYPAMPYTSYALLTDEDTRALYAYFMHDVVPVDEAAPRTDLPFPFNLRFSMMAWNLLFLDNKRYVADPGESEQWNRGAYLTKGLAHCSACHTPRNFLMAEQQSQAFAGAMVGPWFAPNITSDKVSGIGGWSNEELIQYLKTGHVQGKNQAAGGMAEAVQNSLQFLPQDDLAAIAVYLKSTPAIHNALDDKPAHEYGRPISDESKLRGTEPFNNTQTLKSGAALFSGYCASCHQANGAGSKNQAYPSLFHNTATGLSNPANLIAAILYGVDRKVGDDHVLMPRFDEQSYVDPLTNEQIAAISNYVLTQYGNSKVQVSANDVAISRRGGPVPFLAVIQPYIAPAMVVGALLVLLIALLLVRRRRHR